MNSLPEVSNHLRLSHPHFKKMLIVTFVYIFLASFHLSSDFSGVTFVPWPQGFINCSRNGSAFPTQASDLP